MKCASLTPREEEVLDFLIQGKSRKEIAEAMQIATRTVDSFLMGISNKIEIRGMRCLALWWSGIRGNLKMETKTFKIDPESIELLAKEVSMVVVKHLETKKFLLVSD